MFSMKPTTKAKPDVQLCLHPSKHIVNTN